MNRFTTKVTGAVLVLAFLVAGCSASGSGDASEGPSTTATQGLRSVSEWEGSGYDIDWPGNYDFQEAGRFSSQPGVEEAFSFIAGDLGAQLQFGFGILIVQEVDSPIEANQFALRRQLQPLLNEYNSFPNTDEVQATAQGTLSVAPGAPQPGLFVNLLGEEDYGVAAVVPLDGNRVLKMMLVAPLGSDGEADPKEKQRLTEIITSITVG